MSVYKPNGQKYFRFALMVGSDQDGGRKQRVIGTGTADRRVATEIRRKTELLVNCVENDLPLQRNLREWLDTMNPKLQKRLDDLGLIPQDVSLQITSIIDYVQAYALACKTKGYGDGWNAVKQRRLKAMFEEADVRSLRQLKADRLTPLLERLKTEGRGNRTVNTFRSALTAFANWLVMKGHLEKHDLNRLPRFNEKTDRRHPRRPATDEQMRRLLDSVPDHRRYVYTVAVMTGLRRGELNQIERRDIDLVEKKLRVRVEVSKNNEEAVLPLHDEVVDLLREKIDRMEPTDLVLTPIPNILTFQRDLERAGIPYKDENGRFFDFHAMRGTFATRLLRSGVILSKARLLTRHKSVRTLEEHYDMLGLGDAEEAMGQLPGLRDGDAGDIEPPNEVDGQERPQE